MMARRSKPLKAPDKLVFLLSFVPYLLEQRVVDVTEAAQHFGMTEDEIRDAVRLIATSGLPGSTGTYQPNDLFDIDWDSFEDDDVIVIVHHVAIDDAPRLSAREAAALMAGLQYLSASPESAGSASLASLRAKLAAGASSAPSRLAVAETEADASLALIREAVAEGRQLEFDYLNARGERGRRRGVRALRHRLGRHGRRRCGVAFVDGVVGLENGPPRLVHGVPVDLELLVQLVDEPLVGSELAFVRNPEARHLARHAGSPAFIDEDLKKRAGPLGALPHDC